jgi:hypothetical protein
MKNWLQGSSALYGLFLGKSEEEEKFGRLYFRPRRMFCDLDAFFGRYFGSLAALILIYQSAPRGADGTRIFAEQHVCAEHIESGG